MSRSNGIRPGGSPTNVTLEVQVYLDKFGNVRVYDSEQELDSLFQQFGANGSVFNATVTFTRVGSIGFCTEKQKYDYDCSHRLNPDGTCPAADTHKVLERQELSPELQEMAEELSK